jgi:GT2 family glycosyltransferase
VTDVSFVIPTRERPDALRETLGAVQAVDHPGGQIETVVVDNSPSGSARGVAEGAAGRWSVRYAHAPAGGAAAARNHGAALATGRWLIFCDDDMVVEPTHVARHLALQARYPGCLSAGNWEFAAPVRAAWATTPFGRWRLALDHAWRATVPGDRLDEHRVAVGSLSACNLAIEGGAFRALGGFDERFPYAGAEDADFSARARAGGALLVLDDSIRLRHNDQHATFAQFCARERRSAATRAVLYQLGTGDPAAAEFAAVNGPVARRDGPRRVAKKTAKWALGAPGVIDAVTGAVTAVEPVLGDRALAPLYRAVVGVHIQRGYREGAHRRLGQPPVQRP